jgi:hypothetical protein
MPNHILQWSSHRRGGTPINESTRLRPKPAHVIAGLLLASMLACGGGTPDTLAPQTARIEPPQTQETVPPATSEPATPKPSTSRPPTSKPPAPSPTVAPGTFPDFNAFAGQVDQALRDGNASFLTEHSSISVWNCLGDEAHGVCKGKPGGTTLEGIPITDEWQTFTLLSPASYEATWQDPFDEGIPLRLHAIAYKFGDNPLMPLATGAFLAIIPDETTTAESSPEGVRVLFFEYRDNSWWLQGELRTTKQAQEWLEGDCLTCYDQWTAWPH